MIGQGQDDGHDRAAGGRSRAGYLLALVPAAMLAVLLLRKVWDVDIFWQLKLGEMILERGGPVQGEPFAALHLGEPLPAVAWAGQAILALARRVGGWELLRLVDALCWVGGFWAVAAACRLRGAPALAVALALGLSVLPALPAASVRPQSFACLCFGLLLALRRLELRPAPTIGLGAILLVAWQNLHPSVTVGIAAMGLAALPGWFAWLRDRRRAVPLVPTALALAGLAAVFLTPDGVGILPVSARNAEASMAIGASEWLPLWIPANHTNALPVLAVGLVAVWLAMRRPSRVDAAELAVFLGLLVMTVAAYRFVLFWAVAMVPVVARAAGGARRVPPERAHVALMLSCVGLVAALSPVVFPTRFSPGLPLAAVARLKQEGVRGTVYGDFPFGGVIIDTGYPAWRVAYDGRYYRYSRQEWQYNGGIENGIVPLVDVERKWRPAAFVLDSRHNAPLAGELSRSPSWRRIFAADGVVVYVPERR
ncbi:hypothetical protein [Novosphingobium soli]|uniref:Glycosyltransferase RgtA/B/C/D-like domain-containing protein n=1 Tax=Novosphingobium soli TaxID=574956 RepID=A0ABV6CSW6_9SPHN